MNALVIDDTGRTRGIMEDSLLVRGHTCTCYHWPPELSRYGIRGSNVELINSHDLIFLDVYFEGLPLGITFVRSLRQHGSSIPVVLMSATEINGGLADVHEFGGPTVFTRKKPPSEMLLIGKLLISLVYCLNKGADPQKIFEEIEDEKLRSVFSVPTREWCKDHGSVGLKFWAGVKA